MLKCPYLLMAVCMCVATQGLAQNTVSTSIGINGWNQGSCCFTLAYQNDGSINGLNRLEVAILTPGVTFSTLQYGLGNGWYYAFLETDRNLRWTYNSNSLLPTGNDTLFQFCLSGWNNQQDVQIESRWKMSNSVRHTDTISLTCARCVDMVEDTVACMADSSFRYDFNFHNTTSYTLHEVTIEEPLGQDAVLEQTIALVPSLAPGETRDGLSLSLNTGMGMEGRICFELSPRQLTAEGIPVNCCTTQHCVGLPICDHCCNLALEDFEARVNRGIDSWAEPSGPSGQYRLSAHAVALDDCDQVFWTVRPTSSGAALGGLLSGSDTVRFNGLIDTSYLLCMEVERLDLAGNTCGGLPILKICDTLDIGTITHLQVPNEPEDIHLFPNPVRTGGLYLHCPAGGASGIWVVWNALGQVVEQGSIDCLANEQILLPANEWPPGIYTFWMLDHQRRKKWKARMLVTGNQ